MGEVHDALLQRLIRLTIVADDWDSHVVIGRRSLLERLKLGKCHRVVHVEIKVVKANSGPKTRQPNPNIIALPLQLLNSR